MDVLQALEIAWFVVMAPAVTLLSIAVTWAVVKEIWDESREKH